jgi:Acetyltransferase (GNAT) domain
MQERAVSFRLANRQDIPATIELLNHTFRTPVDEASWEWYIYGNPFGESRVYLAMDVELDKPAGIFAFTPVPLRIRGVPTIASSGHHLCLSSTYHGGSVFIALSRFALRGETEQGVTLALGLPNRKSHQPQKVLVKWVDFCMLDCLSKSPPSPSAHTCRMLDRFGGEFEQFYERLTEGLEFFIEKNTAWMNWRFCDRPGRPYTVWVKEYGGKLAGYAVLKRWREPNGYTKAHIVDLHALDDAVLAELLDAAESYAADCQEVNLWAAPGYPYRGLLEERGFAPRPEASQPLIAKALASGSLAPTRGPASFSYADGDFVY